MAGVVAKRKLYMYLFRFGICSSLNAGWLLGMISGRKDGPDVWQRRWPIASCTSIHFVSGSHIFLNSGWLLGILNCRKDGSIYGRGGKEQAATCTNWFRVLIDLL